MGIEGLFASLENQKRRTSKRMHRLESFYRPLTLQNIVAYYKYAQLCRCVKEKY